MPHRCPSARPELKCCGTGVRPGRRVRTEMAAVAGRAGLGLAGTVKVRVWVRIGGVGQSRGNGNPAGDLGLG